MAFEGTVVRAIEIAQISTLVDRVDPHPLLFGRLYLRLYFVHRLGDSFEPVVDAGSSQMKRMHRLKGTSVIVFRLILVQVIVSIVDQISHHPLFPVRHVLALQIDAHL